MTELIRYDAACRAIADARAVDEVKDVRDKAVALQLYARQAKNKTLEVDAAEIRLRAERRLGEMIVVQKQTVGLAKGTRGQLVSRGVIGGAEREPPIAPPTLAQAGIDKKLSARAQKLAAVPADKFEATVVAWRDRVSQERERVTASLLKEGEREQERAAFQARTADGCTVEDLDGLIAAGAKFRAILIDPPARFATWSERGEDRSASRHYDTDAFNRIASLPVQKLAAEDCALFLWMLDWAPQAYLDLIAHWGFVHKTTAFTWVKLLPSGAVDPADLDASCHFGMGYWTRANPEDCWLATRGHPKRLDAGVRQLVFHPVMEHSEKPAEIHARIARLVAGPYLELYGRRPVAGWTVWGNEIARSELPSVPTPDPAPPGDVIVAGESPARGGEHGDPWDTLDIPKFLRRDGGADGGPDGGPADGGGTP